MFVQIKFETVSLWSNICAIQILNRYQFMIFNICAAQIWNSKFMM